MTGLALALLIWFGVGALWDICDPDALTVKFNSPFRALASVAAAVALLVLVGMVLALSTPWIVTIVAGWFGLAAVKAAIES